MGGVTGPVVLAINPGSRSLKVAVRDATGARVFERQVFQPTGDADSTLGEVAERLADAGVTPSAVAHRVVHGGPLHLQPERIDDGLVAALRALVDFAPLHLPGDLASIGAARSRWPDLPQVACFDTAFHATLPPAARRLPVPDAVAALGVRRYGFHGLSIQHVVDTVPRMGRAVVAHLGGGCSVTAVLEGRSVQTSMSFSPTGGLPSVTRSGDLDPEVLLFLSDQGWSTADLRAMVDRSSGLAGMSGGLDDVAELTRRATAGDGDCALALEVFTTSVATTVAGYTALLGGLDTLVFTGGIGEHSAAVRNAVSRRLGHLGVVVDAAEPAPGDISAPGARVRTLVVTADEERVMDHQARHVLRDQGPDAKGRSDLSMRRSRVDDQDMTSRTAVEQLGVPQ
ncbi:MAG: acetate kinase [Blastococcus sp.]|nr:acetate kinase [Blastococcus sp.]